VRSATRAKWKWKWTKGLAALVALGTAAAACSGDDDGGGGSGLSRDDLASASSECPVDLPAAATAAGLDAGGDVAVEVTEGSGDGGPDDAAVDQVGGVYVDCALPVADGELTAVVFASDQPGAIGLLLPQIQHDLALDVDELQSLFDRVDATDEGKLIDLGADGPAAAARIDVDGAESAVLYVSASSGASPEEVRAVAEDLLDRL
jgi:hypothetical protein